MNSRGASRGGSASRSPSRGGGSKRGGSRGGNKGKAKKAADDGEMGTYSERTIWSQRFKGWKRYEVKKPRVVREEDRTKNWIQTFHGRPTTFGGLIGNHLDSVQRTLQTFVDQVSIYRGWLFLYTGGVLFNAEWCIRQLWCSSAIFFNATSITNDSSITL